MSFTVETESATDLVDVTDRLTAAHDLAGDGACLAHVPHTTAALFVQEAEPRLQADLLDALASVFPADAGYAHDQLDGNAHAHLRAAVLGPSVMVPVWDGDLALGRWGSVLLAEFDGPRERRISVTSLDGTG
jgi:secondary thiamine-phosphate synthase enzyme